MRMHLGRIPSLLAAVLLWGALGMAVIGGRGALADTKGTAGVVVLKDGRVFSGTVSEVAGGYRVERSDGHVIIPFDQVRLTADDLPSAYERLRDGIRRPTADDHLVLAEWCLENRLTTQARTEAAAALTLEPLRTDADAMLRKIDRLIDPVDPVSRSDSNDGRMVQTADGYVFRSETGPAGLARETQQEFIRRVQPLLMNGCGNASCHGSASMNEPVLMNVRVGSANHRQASQRNLEVILNHIDAGSPETSPLLKVLDGTDPTHARVFSGRSGADQLLILQNWVAQVARERGGKTAVKTTGRANGGVPGSLPAVPPGAKPLKKSDEATSGVSGGEALDSGAAVTPTGTAPGAVVPAMEARLLEELKTRREPDLFDPEEFNRRAHGLTAAELRARQAATAVPPTASSPSPAPITSPK